MSSSDHDASGFRTAVRFRSWKLWRSLGRWGYSNWPLPLKLKVSSVLLLSLFRIQNQQWDSILSSPHCMSQWWFQMLLIPYQGSLNSGVRAVHKWGMWCLFCMETGHDQFWFLKVFQFFDFHVFHLESLRYFTITWFLRSIPRVSIILRMRILKSSRWWLGIRLNLTTKPPRFRLHKLEIALSIPYQHIALVRFLFGLVLVCRLEEVPRDVFWEVGTAPSVARFRRTYLEWG